MNCFVLAHEEKSYTPNYSLFNDLIYNTLFLTEKSCWNGSYQLPPDSSNFLHLYLKQNKTAKNELTQKQMGLLSCKSTKVWDKVYFQWLVTLLSISTINTMSIPAEQQVFWPVSALQCRSEGHIWGIKSDWSHVLWNRGICLTQRSTYGFTQWSVMPLNVLTRSASLFTDNMLRSLNTWYFQVFSVYWLKDFHDLLLLNVY